MLSKVYIILIELVERSIPFNMNLLVKSLLALSSRECNVVWEGGEGTRSLITYPRLL